MRNKPILLKHLPRLIARMSPHDDKREQLIQTLQRIEAGFAGELRSDLYLERATFKGPVKIFKNVELQITPYNFIQIDTIVMTPAFIVLLEIKNIKGELYFMRNPPCLHRILSTGEKMVIDCPVSQLEKNIADFNLWLEMNGFNCESSGAIVLAYTSGIVKQPPTSMPIYYAKDLPLFLRKKESENHVISPKQFDEISKRLSLDNRRFNPIPLCNYFKIDPATLASGVFCHVCRQKMSRATAKTWHCVECAKDYRNPLSANLTDWFLLINEFITVEECRRFLDLKDRYAARYILNSSSAIEKTGYSIATKYYQKTSTHS